MNFNSTGNNFGAGQIAFKSHQEENFVVLNAKFTYNPENADYQAADVLEPTVGRCDHEGSCGYHLHPREFYKLHPEKKPGTDWRYQEVDWLEAKKQRTKALHIKKLRTTFGLLCVKLCVNCVTC